MAYAKEKDKKMLSVQAYIGRKHFEQLLVLSRILKLPVSRLICIAVDNEFQKEEPFKLNLELNQDEYVEYAFADEAGKLMNFMKGLRNGMSLDLLYVLRKDIGIPDRTIFLQAFNECVKQGIIESYINPPSVKYNNSFETICYRLKSASPEARKKLRKKVSERETYERLKAKYGKDN